MAEFLQTSMAKIKEMVDVNTIVGDPVTTPDGVTLVPVSRVSFGFGGGGGDLVKQRSGFAGGSGAAVRIEPIGFLVIRNGIVNMLNIQPPAANTFDRIVDLIPQLMDKAEQLRDKKADAAAGKAVTLLHQVAAASAKAEGDA